MSASIVDPGHIDVMLSVAINGPKDVSPARYTGPYVLEIASDEKLAGPVTRETADLVGRALMRENIASVSFHSAAPLGDLPGPVPNPDPDLYEWTDLGGLLTAVETLCAIDGFEYQSCEHPGWWGSAPSHFCHRFRKALIRCLRGYEGAEWEWTTEMALARARQGGRWRRLGG